MITWVILAITVLLVLAFIKIEHIGRLTILLILLILLSFLFFSFNRMLKSGEISLNSPKSIITAFVTYGNFLENKTTKFFNATRQGIRFVGDAIKG